MRALAFIVVGLMLGALISVTALNFLNRGPQTHKALMLMMKYQVDSARGHRPRLSEWQQHPTPDDGSGQPECGS